MKRLKYMYSLQRSKKQKQHHSLPQQIYKEEHMQTLKTQAVKTLNHIEQNYLAKTQLNIAFRNSQIPLNNQYQRRSLSQKESLRKTVTSSFIQQQKSKNNKKTNNEHHFEPHNINIKKLLKIKTQSLHQQQHNKLLRNPFYKIQKTRQPSLKYPKTNTPDNSQITHQLYNNATALKKADNKQHQVQIQTNKQQQQLVINSTNINNISEELQQHHEEQFFVSRERKQWYFASKKFRLRTVQQDQEVSAVGVSERIKDKLNESGLNNFSKTPQHLYKKQPHQNSQQKHLRKLSSPSPKTNTPSSSTILQFDKFDSIMHDQQATIIQQSRQQSPNKIRQKSLTVKYHEIKDYFQKKYQYNKPQLVLDQSFIDQFTQNEE